MTLGHFWADCRHLQRRCAGPLWLHRPHRFSNHLLWGRTRSLIRQGQQNSSVPSFAAFTPTPGEQTLALTGQRGSLVSHLTQTLDTTISTLPINRLTASISWGKAWLASIPKPALIPKILDIYTETLPHKNNVSKPRQITVFPKFRDRETQVKWKHRGTTTEKPREIPREQMEEFISVLDNKIKKEVIKTLTEFKKIVDRYVKRN